MSVASAPAGIYHELLTPFSADGVAVDHPKLAGQAQFAASLGPAALVVGTAAGEAMSLSFDERRDVAKTVIAAAGGVPVIVGLGGLQRREALALAAAAAEDGAAAILLENHEYWTLESTAFVENYHAIVEAAGLPAFVVHDERAQPTSQRAQALKAALEIPQVIGLIDRSGDMLPFGEAMCELIEAERPVAMLGGVEELLSTRALGAVGWLTPLAIVVPGLIHDLYASSRDDPARARELNSLLIPLSLLVDVQHPARLKALAASLGRDLGEVRLPFTSQREALAGWRAQTPFAGADLGPEGWPAASIKQSA